MSEFNLCNQTIEFSTDTQNIIDIREEFYRLSIIAEAGFKEEYRRYGSLETAFKETRALGYKYISEAIDKAISIATTYDIYSINRNNFVTFDKRSPNFMENWANIMTSFENLYLELEEQCLSEEQRRAFRKESRDRIVGGGFGISGAAKGMMTAGAVNMATGVAHSIFNSIGNAMTRSSINSEEDKIYHDERILNNLTDELKGIIDFIAFILWRNILKLNNHISDSRIINTIDIYQNIQDGLLSADKIYEVLPTVVHDLWAFEPNIFKNLHFYNLSKEDKKNLKEIAKFLNINFSNINAEIYIQKYKIDKLYSHTVAEMLDGDLEAAYRIAYLVDRDEQDRLIKYLLDNGYERVNILLRLNRLCDKELTNPPNEDIEWLLSIINNISGELIDSFSEAEFRKILLSVLIGRLDELYIEKVYLASGYWYRELGAALRREGLFDNQELRGIFNIDTDRNEYFKFKIQDPNICFNIYEAIEKFKPIIIESDVGKESKEGDDFKDMINSLSKISENLKSINENRNEIIILGAHWTLDVRYRNSDYWLNKAAENGHKEAIEILNSRINDVEFAKHREFIERISNSDEVKEEHEKIDEPNETKAGFCGCLIWIIGIIIIYNLFF